MLNMCLLFLCNHCQRHHTYLKFLFQNWLNLLYSRILVANQLSFWSSPQIWRHTHIYITVPPLVFFIFPFIMEKGWCWNFTLLYCLYFDTLTLAKQFVFERVLRQKSRMGVLSDSGQTALKIIDTVPSNSPTSLMQWSLCFAFL